MINNRLFVADSWGQISKGVLSSNGTRLHPATCRLQNRICCYKQQKAEWGRTVKCIWSWTNQCLFSYGGLETEHWLV